MKQNNDLIIQSFGNQHQCIIKLAVNKQLKPVLIQDDMNLIEYTNRITWDKMIVP